ncbi:hypothetical protein K474DRAFT_1657681 [Panus rudis PR-1116 ss-1]|nr:hypothetical protein K474DRAFT_1657681 [Panus rudis PR-1116 ss-1]
MLTFPQELKCIWSRRVDVVTLLYTSLRYGALCDNIFTVVYSTMTPSHIESCKATDTISIIAVIVVFTALSVFETLRVWLISGKSRWPTIMVFLLTILVPSIDIYLNSLNQYYTLLDTSYGPFSGCQSGASDPVFPYFGVIARAGNTVSIAIALYVTWRKTTHIHRSNGEIGTPCLPSLLNLFFYNGVILFSVLLVLNIINMIIDTFNSTVLNSDVAVGKLRLLYILQHH